MRRRRPSRAWDTRYVEDEREKLQLDWVKVVGAALATMSSALVLSTLGAAGTIIGAALGSVVITVGGSVYSHYLDLSRQRVAAAQAAALRKVGDARTNVRRAATELDEPGEPAASAVGSLGMAERQLHRAASGLREAEQPPRASYRETLKGLPWKRIALAAAGVFLLVMTVITVFELVTGRAVSTYTGGSEEGTRTSITGLVRGGEEGDPAKQPRSPDGESTPTPTSTAETPAPADSVPPTPEDGPTDGVTEDTPAPTGEPTTQPTTEPTAADTAPPAPAPTAPVG